MSDYNDFLNGGNVKED